MAIAAAGQGTSFVQIEGTIKGAHGVPTRGIVVRLPDGTSSVSNGLGHYTLLAPSGFTGAVSGLTPADSFGQTVAFAVHNYTNIITDQTSQDFTYGSTAQGSVSFNILGASGAEMSTNDGQFTSGSYFSFDLPTDGALVVTPEFPGVIFNPTSISYSANSFAGSGFVANSGIQFPLFTAGPVYSGCYLPYFDNLFDGTTPHVYAWALLDSIPGDQFYFDWFDPSGLLWMHSSASLDFSGVGCAWALLDTPAAAMHPGTWRVVFGSHDLIRGQSTFGLTRQPYLTGAIEGQWLIWQLPMDGKAIFY